VSRQPDAGEPMSAGRRDPGLVRLDAVRRAAAAAATLSGTVRARSIRLDELGALLGAIEPGPVHPHAPARRPGPATDHRPGPAERPHG
jgi:hypothetical protein